MPPTCLQQAGGSIYIDEDDAVTLGTISASNATGLVRLETLAAGNLTITGPVTGNDIAIATFAGGNGNIVVNNSVGTATSDLTELYADGSITGAGVISGVIVELDATNGSIGTSAAARAVVNAGTDLDWMLLTAAFLQRP